MACQSHNSTETIKYSIKENYDNYLLIDVGSNMVNKKFSRDLESVLLRAKDSGMFRTVYESNLFFFHFHLFSSTF